MRTLDMDPEMRVMAAWMKELDVLRPLLEKLGADVTGSSSTEAG